MRIDMTPILEARTDKVGFSFDSEIADGLFADKSFPVPVHVDGEVVNRSGYMFLTLNAKVKYKTQCARCLEEIERDFSLDLTKNVAMDGEISDDDDVIVIRDSGIETDEPLEELLFLELPSRDLCKEDCAGLCTKCGANLNYGECGCEKKEIDPRLAVLKKYLDNNN